MMSKFFGIIILLFVFIVKADKTFRTLNIQLSSTTCFGHF